MTDNVWIATGGKIAARSDFLSWNPRGAARLFPILTSYELRTVGMF